MEPLIRVGAIDNDRMLLQGTAAWCATAGSTAVTVLASTVDEFLATTQAGHHLDVVLLDLRLEDGSHPADNVKRLVRLGHRVLVTSVLNDQQHQIAVLRAGAAGFVGKENSLDILTATMREVAAGTHRITPELALAVANDAELNRPALSEQEFRTVDLYASGLPTKAVAREMGISTSTVDTYIERVKHKYREADRPAYTRDDLRRRLQEDDLGSTRFLLRSTPDVLLVADRTRLPDLVARQLEREIGARVTTALAAGAPHAVRTGHYTVAVIDLRYDRPALDRPTTNPIDLLPWRRSGLSIAADVLGLDRAPQIVFWCEGLDDERLPLIWAKQELEIHVFSARAAGTGPLGTLPEAIAAAVTGHHYTDRSTAELLLPPDTPRLHGVLLQRPLHRAVWAALAAGYATDQEIGSATGYAPKTIRNAMSEMLPTLRTIDPAVPPDTRPQTSLLRYATQHQRFFLDVQVHDRDDR